VVVRFLRVRARPGRGATGDCLQFSSVDRAVLDHLSLYWAEDETVDLWARATNITVQWCTLEESSLTGPPQDGGGHYYGLIAGARSSRISIHHNLFAHHENRNPCIGSGPADFRNNVVYNFHAGFVHHNNYAGKPGFWPRMSGGFLGLADTDMTAVSEARPFGKGSIVLTSADRVAEHVQPVVKIDPPQRDVRACQRFLENGAVCFLTNEGEETVSLSVRLATEGTAKVCDPLSGKISLLPASRRDGSVRLVLPPAGSCLVLIDDSPAIEEAGECAPPKEGEGLELAAGWECRPLVSYEVGDEDFVRREVEDAPWQSVRLGDWRAAVGEDFSGWVEYRIVFNCPEQVAAGAGRLSLGKVCYAASARLNGHDLGRRVWEPYVFCVSGILARGENELRLVVSNTLANQLTSDRVKRQWEAKEDRDWDHSFHRLALRFETESRESGLFGPVRIY